MRNLFKALKKDERGVSALEYAILAGLMVVAIVTGVTAFGTDVQELFSSAGTALDKVGTEVSSADPKAPKAQ